MEDKGGGRPREGRPARKDETMDCTVDLTSAGPSHMTAVPRSSSADSATKRKRTLEDNGQENERLVEMRKVSDRMREILIENGTRMTKSNVMTLVERISEMESLMLRVMLDNERLKGQLSECRVAEMRNVKEKETLVKSYASVTSTSVRNNQGMNVSMSVPPAKRAVAKHAVVVRPQKEGDMSAEDIKKRIMRTVKPAVTDVRINAVRMMRNGGITIETASAEELQKLSACSKFREAGLKVETPRKIGPKMIIYDVPLEWTTNAFMREVYERNLSDVCSKDEFNDRARVLSRGGKKDSETGNVIVEMSAKMCERLRESGRIYVEWHALKIKEFEMVTRCYGCYGYGHMMRECKEKDRVCRKCGKVGHVMSVCRSTDEVCRNCQDRKQDARHSVMSERCPEYMKALERMRERIHYE